MMRRQLTYRRGYPPITNHAEQARRTARAAAAVLGTGKVHREMPPVMGRRTSPMSCSTGLAPV